MLKKITIACITLLSASLLTSPAMGWGIDGLEDLDPTNPDSDIFGDGESAPIQLPTFGGGEEGYSCTQSIVPPIDEQFDMLNQTSWNVAFRVNSTDFRLEPGQSMRISVRRRNGGTDGCDAAGNPYFPVTFEWDTNPYIDGWQTQVLTVTGNADDWYALQGEDYITLY
jgi:hypothetical protein